MSRQIEMKNGENTILVQTHTVEHFKKLGYNVVSALKPAKAIKADKAKPTGAEIETAPKSED